MIYSIVRKVRYVKSSLIKVLNINNFLKTQLIVNSINHSNTNRETKVNASDEADVIVSLTTYGKRIHNVYLTIETISMQTIRPKKVILWLDEQEFTLENLPITLMRMVGRGLEIRFCSNIKSYKKLIPTKKNFPNDNIITIDDDILYPHDMIEILLKEGEKYPNYVIGTRAHKILTKDGEIQPYLKWEIETKDSKPSHDIFITSGAGTLFPAGLLSEKLMDEKLFMDHCPNADDIWFKAICIISDVKCKKVDDTREYGERYLTLPDDQDIGLFNNNVNGNGNDVQIRNTFDALNITRRT